MVLELSENALTLGDSTVAEWRDFNEDTDAKTRRVMWRMRLLAQREKWTVITGDGLLEIWRSCQEEFEQRHSGE